MALSRKVSGKSREKLKLPYINYKTDERQAKRLFYYIGNKTSVGEQLPGCINVWVVCACVCVYLQPITCVNLNTCILSTCVWLVPFTCTTLASFLSNVFQLCFMQITAAHICSRTYSSTPYRGGCIASVWFNQHHLPYYTTDVNPGCSG